MLEEYLSIRPPDTASPEDSHGRRRFNGTEAVRLHVEPHFPYDTANSAPLGLSSGATL